MSGSNVSYTETGEPVPVLTGYQAICQSLVSNIKIPGPVLCFFPVAVK